MLSSHVYFFELISLTGAVTRSQRACGQQALLTRVFLCPSGCILYLGICPAFDHGALYRSILLLRLVSNIRVVLVEYV